MPDPSFGHADEDSGLIRLSEPMNESLFLTFLFQIWKWGKEIQNQDKPQESLCTGRIVEEKEALFVE